MWRIYATHLGL